MGFILASMVFFGIKGNIVQSEPVTMTDQEIEQRAAELGLVKVTRVDEVYLTDDEVILRAIELGLEFTTNGAVRGDEIELD